MLIEYVRVVYYEYVDSFPKWKDIMEKIKIEGTTSYATECSGEQLNIRYNKFNFNTNCPKACLYLNKIDGDHYRNDNLKRAACIYMYYSIYDHLKEEGSDSQIQR
ncbi:variable surface protein, partial [Plasmodium gonderi]